MHHSVTPGKSEFGVGPTIVLTAISFSIGGIAYPLAPKSFPLPALMAGQVLLGFGTVAYNITQVSLLQAITPERLQGRMNAAMRWILWGGNDDIPPHVLAELERIIRCVLEARG